MLFNALHREGTNLAMASGRMAAEAILEALGSGDLSRKGLAGYVRRLQSSYVIKDMAKYRRFPHFLQKHKELFTTLPGLTSLAAREMLTVNGIPKKASSGLFGKPSSGKCPFVNPCASSGMHGEAWR